MRPPSFLMLFVAVIVAGCSSSNFVTSSDLTSPNPEINRRLEGKEIRITLLDNHETEGSDLRVGADSARWVDLKSHDTVAVPTDSLKTVVRTNRLLGGLEGLGLGIAIGLPVGFVAGLVAFGGGSQGDLSGLAGVVMMGGGAAAGALGGTIIGLSTGHDEVYAFPGSSSGALAIRTYNDTIRQPEVLRHVIVTYSDGRQDFGSLISRIPTLVLRTRKDRVIEAPLKSVISIESIHAENYSITGLANPWLITRNDGSTVVAAILVDYQNGLLQTEFSGSSALLPLDDIQSFERIDRRSIWQRGYKTGLVLFGLNMIAGIANGTPKEAVAGGAILGGLAMCMVGWISQVFSPREIYTLSGLSPQIRLSRLQELLRKQGANPRTSK